MNRTFIDTYSKMIDKKIRASKEVTINRVKLFASTKDSIVLKNITEVREV